MRQFDGHSTGNTGWSNWARSVVTSWRWWLLFFALGHLALGIQVYLVREYMIALAGDEAAVGIGLFAWLLGIGLGARAAQSLSPKRASTAASFAVILLSAVGLPEMLLARSGRRVLHLPLGELASLGPALLLALAVFALPGACVGAAFVFNAMLIATREPGARLAVGALYTFESLGSLIAGALTSFVLFGHTDPCSGMGVVLAIGLGCVLPAALARWTAARGAIGLMLAAATVFAATPVASRVERITQEARFQSLVPRARLQRWVDSPYEHLAVGVGPGHDLYSSGLYVRSYPDDSEDELRAHRLMLLSAEPKRVLALGGVDPSTLRHCLKHPVTAVDWVVLDRQAFELTTGLLSPEDKSVLSDPRVHLHFTDARRYLSTRQAIYDIVLLLEREPSTLLLARETSTQFSRLVASRLAPNGTFVMRLATGPNVQAGETGLLGAVLYRTLSEVFPFVQAAPGPDGVLVAGKAQNATSLDAALLESRWRARGIVSNVFAPELLTEFYPPERVATLNREIRKAAADAHASSDNHPASFLFAMVLRQQQARSVWSSILQWASRHPRPLGVLLLSPSLLILGWLVMRRMKGTNVVDFRLAASHAVLAVGFTAMAWNLMLLFSFQTRVGALYSQLGLLSALFMLGLALGGAWASLNPVPLLVSLVVSWFCSVCVTLVFVILDFAQASLWGSAFLHGLLLILAGFATGGIFPAAVDELARAGLSTRRSVSLVQFADHFGAALAALGVSAVFVSSLGLVGQSVLLCCLQTVALVGFRVAGTLVRGRQ